MMKLKWDKPSLWLDLKDLDAVRRKCGGLWAKGLQKKDQKGFAFWTS